MSRFIKIALFCFSIAFGTSSALASPITYNVNDSFGGGSITGTLQTNGTIGTISSIASFLNWNITLNDGTHSSVLNNANSYLYTYGAFQFNATSSDLTFDHNFGQFFLIYENNSVGYWCLEGPNSGCDGAARQSSFNVNFNNSRAGQVNSGVRNSSVFLTAGNSAPVPEPTTLVLFGLGLAGLAFGRRKTS